MKHPITAALVLLAFCGFAQAWKPQTYEIMALRLCDYYGCGCEEAVMRGSLVPDEVFKDQPTHHCYRPNTDYSKYLPDFGDSLQKPLCPELFEDSSWELARNCILAQTIDKKGALTHWKKPVLDECPALEKADAWLKSAQGKTGCARWHDIGIALHYFLDANKFWNTVIDVNRTCVQQHDDGINDYMMYSGGDFISCSCGICMGGSDFKGWLLEFSEMVKPLVEAGKTKEPKVHIISNDLDKGAAEELAAWLGSQNIGVELQSPDRIDKARRAGAVIIIGGHKAPGVGPIADSVLTQGDKDRIINSVFEGVIIKKLDVWAVGQTVFFMAGHGIEETYAAAQSKRHDILDEIIDAHASEDIQPECSSNDDCGTPYWGPWICSTKKTASRVLYDPRCSFGECVLTAQRPTSKGCMGSSICVPLLGCVSKHRVPEVESHIVPLFKSRMSHQTATALLGANMTYSIYIMHNITGSTENLTCQRYESEQGWEDIAGDWPRTIELRYGFYAFEAGKHVITNRIRCANVTKNGELLTLYGAEHNFTANVVPPAFSFTLSVEPRMLELESCFDKANATVRIESLASDRIVCDYQIAQYAGRIKINSSSKTYNVTGGYWTWSLENETHEYLSYYSGSDFINAAGDDMIYEKTDADGQTIVYNHSNIIPHYINETRSITISTPQIHKYSGDLTYNWSYNPWHSMTFEVGSGQCQVYKHLVTVRCEDVFGQVSTASQDLFLNLTHIDMSHLYDGKQ